MAAAIPKAAGKVVGRFAIVKLPRNGGEVGRGTGTGWTIESRIVNLAAAFFTASSASSGVIRKVCDRTESVTRTS